jgi:hypothetical protein
MSALVNVTKNRVARCLPRSSAINAPVSNTYRGIKRRAAFCEQSRYLTLELPFDRGYLCRPERGKRTPS